MNVYILACYTLDYGQDYVAVEPVGVYTDRTVAETAMAEKNAARTGRDLDPEYGIEYRITEAPLVVGGK